MLARRANDPIEHAMLAEAATTWAATESIDRKLGEELIAAARQVVAAWHDRGRLDPITHRPVHPRRAPRTSCKWVELDFDRMRAVIGKLEELVGRPNV